MSWQRSFLALELPDDVRERLRVLGHASLQEEWRIKWVEPQNLHLTLHFLGPLSSSGREKLGQQLRQVLPGLEPFYFSLQGVGTFPSGQRPPRVIWAGVDQGRDCLLALHRLVQRSIRKSGMEPDRRAYHPHVTLGRVRQPGRGSFLEQVEALVDRQWGEVWAAEVVLLDSRLEPRGPVYTELERFALGSASRGQKTSGDKGEKLDGKGKSPGDGAGAD